MDHLPSPSYLRQRRNSELVRRVRCGGAPAQVFPVTSRFPPQPVTQKDKQTVDFLYFPEKNQRNHSE
jgi:hypothetical protein